MVMKFKLSKIIIFFCKLSGLIPLNHRNTESLSISNYFFMVLYPICYLGALIVLFTYPVLTATPLALSIDGCKSICFFTHLTFLTLGGFSYSMCVISSLKKKKFFLYYYGELEKFDQHFNKCNVVTNIKIKTDYIRVIMAILIHIIFVCIGIFGSLTYLQFKPNILHFTLITMCTVFPISAATLYQLLFAYMILEIGTRFERINYIFRIINKKCNKKTSDSNIFDVAIESNKIRHELELEKKLVNENKSQKNEDTTNFNTEKSEDEDEEDDSSESDDLSDREAESLNCEHFMVDLFQVHEKISSLGVTTNKEFSTAIVSFMTATFIISIFGIFLLTKVLFTIRVKYDLLVRMTLYVILWTAYLLITAYLILRICCHAQTESRKTALLIHEIMQKRPKFMLGNDDYYNKMKCFTLQYLHWETYFNFNGNGLFQLDYTFIFSAVSAGTSYLIVLLQFDLNAVL